MSGTELEEPGQRVDELESQQARVRERLTDRQWLVALILIGLLALAVRVPLALTALPLAGDPVDYQRNAASIAVGHGFPPTTLASPGTPSSFRPPAYPYLLGGLYAVVGIHPDAGRLLGSLLGVLTVLMVAVLGAQMWDRRVGLIAGTLAAVCPSLAALNSTLLSESLFLPLELAVAMIILALTRSRRDRSIPRTGNLLLRAVFLGALCAVATLTRNIGLVWLPLGAVAILRVRTEWSRRLMALGAMVGAFLILCVPWTIRNLDTFHAFLPLGTQDGVSLAGEYNSVSANDELWRLPSQVPSLVHSLAPLYRRPGGINEAQLDHVLRHDGLEYIRGHPGQVLNAMAVNTLRLFNLGIDHQFTTAIAYREMSLPTSLRNPTTISIQVITILAILVLLARTTGIIRRRLGPPLLWLVPLLAIAATVPVAGTVRYRVTLDPFLILLVALGVDELWGGARARRARREVTSEPAASPGPQPALAD